MPSEIPEVPKEFREKIAEYRKDSAFNRRRAEIGEHELRREDIAEERKEIAEKLKDETLSAQKRRQLTLRDEVLRGEEGRREMEKNNIADDIISLPHDPKEPTQ